MAPDPNEPEAFGVSAEPEGNTEPSEPRESGSPEGAQGPETPSVPSSPSTSEPSEPQAAGSVGPIPGTATTYGRDHDAVEAERKAGLPPHVARAGHRSDVAPAAPPGDPLGPPIRELPGEYETLDGYAVVQDLLETYHLHKSGAPRAQLEQLHGRLIAGARAWENRPNVEDPLGDAPIEG